MLTYPVGEIVGFTGTQGALTRVQLKRFYEYLSDYRPRRLHHGDCIGADAIAHALARSLEIAVTSHPPTNPAKRAFCQGGITLPVKPYLDRNHDIVDTSHRLIACPSAMTEQLRSGTWATVRYARKRGRPILIFYPDGSTASEQTEP